MNHPTLRTSASRSPLRVTALVAALLALTQLQGCFPVMAGAIGGAAMISMDRRSTSTQAIDRGLQIEADARLAQNFARGAHLNASALNRKLLLTGQVEKADMRVQAEQLMRSLPNVREIANEIAVTMPTSYAKRSEDALITSAVKSALIATRDVPSNSMRIVTEANTVYLMGLVTADEAERAVKVTASVVGVRKVVKLFDLISEEERQRLDSRQRSGDAAIAGTASQPAAEGSAIATPVATPVGIDASMPAATPIQ